VLRAIDRLRELLTSNGEILFTIPHGWHTELDPFIAEGQVPFAGRWCMKRISDDDRWIELGCDELHGIEYDSPFPFANGLTVSVIRRS
jgi:hypothetical protein